ncbi:MAG: hypothetical protein JO314_06240 [Acidobacteria bacterium]|nr:hypothetical protein [Acidobacteriota bacterium]
MDNSGKSALGLDSNVAAGLAYLPVCGVGLIMSIIIIVTDKTNKFARFAAFQSLLLWATLIVGYVLTIVVAVAGAAAQSTIISLFSIVVWLVFIIVPILALLIGCIMGFMGKQFKVPVIGGMADNWSN